MIAKFAGPSEQEPVRLRRQFPPRRDLTRLEERARELDDLRQKVLRHLEQGEQRR